MKSRLFFKAVLLTLSVSVNAQPLNIGHVSVEMRDSERGNRKVPVDIYYPSEEGGYGAKVSKSPDEKYPVICFAHGYLLHADAYSNIWEALVPEKYIMIFLKTETGMFPSHEALAEDMVFALAEAGRYGRDRESMFYNLVDTMNCVMGHSMGGGASWLAAAKNPAAIKAVVPLTPLYSKALSAETESIRTMPLLVISGSKDCITSTANHSMPIFHESAGDEKTLIEIKGGSHCQVGEKMALCEMGEALSFCGASISKAEQHAVIERYLLPWLRHHLKGDVEAGELFDQTLPDDEAVSFFGISRHLTPDT
jgi:pimeloyl-ACP methyl ester carboxylesterase